MNEEPGGGWLVIGQVVCRHVLESLYEAGRINTVALKPVGRLAGHNYLRTDSVFELKRPGR